MPNFAVSVVSVPRPLRCLARGSGEWSRVTLSGASLPLAKSLAPAEALFQHILARHGQPVEDVAASISGHWGPRAPNLDRTAFANLMPEIQERSNTPIARAMDSCHEALGSGDYAGAIRSLVEWNSAVMESRGAAPWVRLGERRRLDVRYRGIEPRLPDRGELPELWRNSYFIDALKLVTRQLRPRR